MKICSVFLIMLLVPLQEELSFLWLVLRITESKRQLSVQPLYKGGANEWEIEIIFRSKILLFPCY